MQTNNSLEVTLQQVIQGESPIFIVGTRHRSGDTELSAIGDGATLQEAVQRSWSNLQALAQTTGAMNTPAQSGTLQQSPASRTQDKGGGGNKPISDKQVSLIERICAERSIDCEKIVGQAFNKPLGQLKGMEANQLIKDIKGGRYADQQRLFE